jgi:hypothetical protein
MVIGVAVPISIETDSINDSLSHSIPTIASMIVLASSTLTLMYNFFRCKRRIVVGYNLF